MACDVGATVTKSLVEHRSPRKHIVVRSIGSVSTRRFGEAEGHLNRRRAREVVSVCARESKAPTGGFLRGKLNSDQYRMFSSYESQLGAANEQESRGVFRDAQGFGRLDAGSRTDLPAQGLPRHEPRCHQLYLSLQC